MMIRHSLLYLPAQIVGPLMQLVAMVVWTHLVSEHTLGIITLVIATHELLQIGFLAWWSQYALRFYGRFQTDEDADRFSRTENTVLATSVVLQSLAATGILLTVVASDASNTLIAATIAYVMTRAVSLYISERARVSHQIGIYSVQQIIGPTAGFAIGWLLITLISAAAEWVLIGYALAQLLSIVIVLPLLNYGRRFRPLDRDILKHAVQYGIPLLIGGSLGWLGLNAPRFIVNDMIGVAAAGLFAVGYGLGQRAAAVAAMLVTAAAYPLAVKSMEEKGSNAAMQQLSDNGALLLAAIIPTTIGVFMLRDEIVSLLIAETFRTTTLAILPFSVLAGSIRSVRAHFCDQVFLLHNRTRISAVVSAVEALAAVGFGIAGTLAWGIVGAAIASVAATLLAAIISFSIGLARFHLAIPFTHLARIAVASATMAAALTMVSPARDILILIGHIAGGGTIYVLVITLSYTPWLIRKFSARSNLTPAE
jgi:O-antigen/teichoic acid export membrane protein